METIRTLSVVRGLSEYYLVPNFINITCSSKYGPIARGQFWPTPRTTRSQKSSGIIGFIFFTKGTKRNDCERPKSQPSISGDARVSMSTQFRHKSTSYAKNSIFTRRKRTSTKPTRYSNRFAISRTVRKITSSNIRSLAKRFVNMSMRERELNISFLSILKENS